MTRIRPELPVFIRTMVVLERSINDPLGAIGFSVCGVMAMTYFKQLQRGRGCGLMTHDYT